MMRFLLLICLLLFAKPALADWETDAQKALNENRTSDAFEILRPLADEGNAQAAWLMGYAIEKEISTFSLEEQLKIRDGIQLQLHYWEIAAWKKHAQAALNLGLVYMDRYPVHRNGAGVSKDLDRARVYLEIASQNGNEQAKELLAGWDTAKVWYCVGEAFPATPLGIGPERNRLKATIKFHTYSNRMDWEKNTFECDYNDGLKVCRSGKKIFGFDWVPNYNGTLNFYYVSGLAELLTVANGTCETF